MAHIHRALRLLLVFCAALSAQLALAAFPATSTPGTPTYYHDGPTNAMNFTSQAAWWSYYKSNYNANHPYKCGSYLGGSIGSGTCSDPVWSLSTSVDYTSATGGYYGYNSSGAYLGYYSVTLYMQKEAVLLCPANSTQSGSDCTCNAGFAESGGTCVAPPTCPTAGTSAGGGRVTLTASQKSATAANGGFYYWRDDNDCVVKLSLDVCTTGDNGATWQCAGSESYTGAYDTGTPGNGAGDGTSGTSTTASTTPPPGEENKPTSCPTGQCPGEVNGLSVCKPCSSVSTKKPKVEEKTNNDGTKEQKETLDKTTCTGTQCTTESTTTTTNKDASGAVTGTSTVTTVTVQAKGDFCKDNPNAEQCKDEKGEWGGSCAAGFTCSGDAVQCALAREVHRNNCELNAVTSASSLYDAAKDVTGNTTGTNPNNSTFAITSGSFNTSDAIGGAQCIQDLNVEVWGSALSLPLSSICGPLGYLGDLLVLVSLLLAARIVTRG